MMTSPSNHTQTLCRLCGRKLVGATGDRIREQLCWEHYSDPRAAVAAVRPAPAAAPVIAAPAAATFTSLEDFEAEQNTEVAGALAADKNGWGRDSVWAYQASDVAGDYALGTAYEILWTNGDARMESCFHVEPASQSAWYDAEEPTGPFVVVERLSTGYADEDGEVSTADVSFDHHLDDGPGVYETVEDANAAARAMALRDDRAVFSWRPSVPNRL